MAGLRAGGCLRVETWHVAILCKTRMPRRSRCCLLNSSLAPKRARAASAMYVVLLFMRAQELYVLMRIHHVLCDRLGKAVTLAEDAKALKDMQVSQAKPRQV